MNIGTYTCHIDFRRHYWNRVHCLFLIKFRIHFSDNLMMKGEGITNRSLNYILQGRNLGQKIQISPKMFKSVLCIEFSQSETSLLNFTQAIFFCDIVEMFGAEYPPPPKIHKLEYPCQFSKKFIFKKIIIDVSAVPILSRTDINYLQDFCNV